MKLRVMVATKYSEGFDREFTARLKEKKVKLLRTSFNNDCKRYFLEVKDTDKDFGGLFAFQEFMKDNENFMSILFYRQREDD